MASMIALLAEHDELVPGNVLPIDRYLTNPRALANVSRGGTLYLVAIGPKQELFLVAALEQPERSRIFKGDKRPDGWYAPANTVPVTDISELRKALKITKVRQGELADEPIEITKAMEDKLRALFDDRDAPVLEEAPARAANLEESIAELLAIWQRTRAVEVADLIDRATRLLPRADHPLLDTNDEESGHAAWMKTWNDEAERAAAMPRLLRSLLIGWNRDLEARLAVLQKQKDDPRIVRQLAQRLHAVATPHAVERVAKIVARGREPTAWAAIAAIFHELEDLYSTTRRDAFAFTTDSPSTQRPTAAEQARLHAIAAELAPLEADRTEWELVDAIAEHPDDDGPYLVYADWLQSQHHPRGEYIALACQKRAKGLSAALARRLAALENVPYLAGPIDDLATTRRRPCPRGIDRDLDVYWNTTELAWREAALHPLARAIRTLSFVGVEKPQRVYGIVAFAQAAPKLQRMEGFPTSFASQILKLLGHEWRLDGDAVVRR